VARHTAGDDKILPLQFVLVAIIVSLFPATAYGLFLQARGLVAEEHSSKVMLGSIIAGFLAGLSIYLKALVFGGTLNDVFQWAPVASLGASGLLAVVAIAVDSSEGSAKQTTESAGLPGGKQSNEKST
jgi:hypothetical protein